LKTTKDDFESSATRYLLLRFSSIAASMATLMALLTLRQSQPIEVSATDCILRQTSPRLQLTIRVSPPPLDLPPPMDEFAQTRGSDDLFDDDFTPISPPINEPETSSPTPAVPQPRRPSQPQNEGPKTQAVRGDRSGTGGVKKVGEYSSPLRI
jgi:hypothetical protein